MSSTRFDVINALQNRNAISLDNIIIKIKQSQVEFSGTQLQAFLEDQIKEWNKESELDSTQSISITEIIRVLRKQDIPVDLSILSAPILSNIMKNLFLLKPTDAEWALSNMHSIPAISLSLMPIDVLKTETHLFDVEENKAMYTCLSKITIPPQFYSRIIENYIQANSELAVLLAIQQLKSTDEDEAFYQISLDDVFKKILIHDSPRSLMEFINQNRQAGEVKDEYANGLLKSAIAMQAPRSVAVLINEFNISSNVIDELTKKAADDGNLVILSALLKNDYNKVADCIFKDAFFPLSGASPISIKMRIRSWNERLIAMLRFSPIEAVDKVVDAYVSNNVHDPLKKQFLLEHYTNAKKAFLQCAPTFSRYTNQIAYDRFSDLYGRNTQTALREKAKNDMEYGEKRHALVTHLIDEMTSPTAANTFIPTRPEIIRLPPSLNGSRIFATLLERISDYNANTQNSSNYKESPFYLLNESHSARTPVAAQYEWGKSLISSVFHHSQSKQIIKYFNQDTNATNNQNNLYSLTYNGSTITKVISQIEYSPMLNFWLTWHHGKLPLEATIGDIENLVESMLKKPLSDPGPNATQNEIQDYQDKLTEFYVNAAQLVWLIGNTQPLQRGSGTLAELTLKTLFDFHGLQAPILKSAFAQLDVLDITFPQDDYSKLFPYFCEPSTLPEHLRKPSLSHLSTHEQIEAFYQEINGISLIARDVKTTAPIVETKTLPDDAQTRSAKTSAINLFNEAAKKVEFNAPTMPSKTDVKEADASASNVINRNKKSGN